MMGKVSAVRQAYEKRLKKVAKRFPSKRRKYLMAYVRQVEAQMLGSTRRQKKNLGFANAEEERWAKAIVAEELRPLLNKLAEEALVEHRLGKLNSLVSKMKGEGE